MLSAPHAPSPHFEPRDGADEGVDAAADVDDGRCSMVTAASTRTTMTTSTACRPVTCAVARMLVCDLVSLFECENPYQLSNRHGPVPLQYRPNSICCMQVHCLPHRHDWAHTCDV